MITKRPVLCPCFTISKQQILKFACDCPQDAFPCAWLV